MTKEKPEKEQDDPESQPQQETAATKFFNESEYSTVTIVQDDTGGAKLLKQSSFVKTLVSLLDSGNPADKDSALELLKKENAVDYLLEAIRATESNDKKAILLAACWESGLDFKGHHAFFIEYAFHVNPLVSLEAITVLDTNREGIPKEELPGLIEKLGSPAAAKHDNAVLLEDLKVSLFEQMKEG